MNENGQSSGSQKQQGSSIFLLIGVLASVAIVTLSWTHFYEDLESNIYDFRFQIRNDLFGQPHQWPAIATVDIDDLALQSYGWPFTRNRHAALLEVLHQYGTNMIGFDIFFYEPSEPLLSPEVVAGQDKESLSKDEIIRLIEDHDQELQIATQNSQIVYLAQTFEIAEQGIEFAKQNLRKRTPAEEAGLTALERFSIPLDPAIETGFYHTMDIEIPLVQFINAAKGVGFALPKPDHDGIVRRYRMGLVYDGRIYLSLALIMACDYLQVPLQNVRFIPGQNIELPDAIFPDGTVRTVKIPVTNQCEMLVNWAGEYHKTFRHLPYNLILDFAQFEPGNRALKIAKRISHQNPEVLGEDTLYLEKARAEGGDDLPAETLLEMRNVVLDCQGFEMTLQENPDLTPEGFLAAVGVPEASIAEFADAIRPSFNRIKNNLQILAILQKDPNLPLDAVAQKMGIARLEDIQLGVGILGNLIRKGGVKPEDHPLFFLDRIKSAGLQDEGGVGQVITESDFNSAVLFYGLTATGTHDLNPTPFGPREAMLGAHVNVFNTILTQNFLERIPKWGNAVVMLALGLLMGFLIPRFRALPGAGIVLLLLSAYMVAAFLVFAKFGIWMDVLGPVSTLIIGYLSITLYNYIQKEKEKEFVQGAFGHYLDPKVIDELVQNPEQLGQLGGDLRIMTAFFSDVASFSSMSENLTPVELVELLNEYLTNMCDIIAESGGTIDKFEGDAIIAFWGAPIPFEDHAQRSVIAAIDMQHRIDELRARWEREGKMMELRQIWSDRGLGEFFRVRMGINSGEMVVGNMGSNTRIDYTIMGDSVNLAARLEGAGKAYGVTSMVAEPTFRAARELVEARELDSIRVVGKDEAVRVYEILGRKGEVDTNKLEVVDFFNRATAMYRERRWDESIALFEAGLKIDSQDGPCRIFIDRCHDYKQSPPPEDWDAIYSLDSK